MNKVLELDRVGVSYFIKNGFRHKDELKAVTNASFIVEENDIFGLVGESGCGKSSLCNAILGFNNLQSGKITFCGRELVPNSSKKVINNYREGIDVIFQNPYSSLNPRFKIWQIVSEPLYLKGIKDEVVLKNKALEILLEVGLNENDLERYVFEFSGGQRQRIAIARSLINRPSFIVLDEPTSALDVSVQAQICNLLKKLKDKYNLTYLLVSHNLGLIYQLTNKMAVMYCGQIVEIGDTKEIFTNPKHPYTRGLISAILDAKKDNNTHFYYDLKGEVDSALNAPNSCRFYNRCPFKKDMCQKKELELVPISSKHSVACLHTFN